MHYLWVPAAPSWVPEITEAHWGSGKEEKKTLKPTKKDITDICWQIAINSAKTGACYLAVSWDPRLNGKTAITVQPPSSECSPFVLGEGRWEHTTHVNLVLDASQDWKRRALVFGVLLQLEGYAVNCYLLCKTRAHLYKGSSLSPFLQSSRHQSELAGSLVNLYFSRMGADLSSSSLQCS